MVITSHPRILHIASGDLWAGAEVQLFTLAKTLHSGLGVPVSVVLLNHGRLEQQLRDTGIGVTVLDESNLNGIQILFRLVQIIREQSPDVIHTHRQKENTLGSVAAVISGRVPSLRTSHGAPEHNTPWWKIHKRIIHALDWICGRFLQKRIIAVSDELAFHLQQKFPQEIVRVIENGIDIQDFKQQQKRLNTSNTFLPDFFRIGLAGRLSPVKRVDLFIQVARYLRDYHPDLKASFHIFGDGPMRNQLVALNRALGTEDFVFFEGHSDDIVKELRTLDALLITSDHEGLPMILLEAMAVQTPVIAHAVGGIPKVLDQGACGILVPEHLASDYAAAVYRLANSSQLRSEITKNALKRVATNYSAELNARRYLAEYLAVSNQSQ